MGKHTLHLVNHINTGPKTGVQWVKFNMEEGSKDVIVSDSDGYFAVVSRAQAIKKIERLKKAGGWKSEPPFVSPRKNAAVPGATAAHEGKKR